MDKVRILQLNLNKDRTGLSELYNFMITNDIALAAVQEPYVNYLNVVPSSSSFFIIHHNSTDRPRAALIISKKLQIFQHVEMFNRDLIVCSIKMKGTEITIMSAYLPPARDARGQHVDVEPHLEAIEKAVRSFEKNLIVCGDFNGHHVAWGSPKNNLRGEDVNDFFARNDLHLVNTGDEPTFQSSRGSSHIDLTFATAEIYQQIDDWNVNDGVVKSDHRLITFSLENKEFCCQTGTRKYCTRKADWEKFRSFVRYKSYFWRKLISEAKTTEKVEKAAEIILLELMDIADKSLKKARPANSCTPWWNQEISRLQKLVRKFRRRHLECKSPYLKEQYLDGWKASRKDFKKAVLKSKRESWARFLEEQRAEQIWSKVFRICKDVKAYPPTSIRISDDVFTKNAQETAEHLLNAFLPDDDHLDDDRQKKIRDEAICDCRDVSTDIPPFVLEEVSAIIQRQNDNRSPGKDGLSANVIKQVHSVSPDILLNLYNACLKVGCFPKVFKHSVVKAIPKQGASDKSSPKSWRPVSLLPVPGKVLEKLMINKVNAFLGERTALSENQFGFTPGKSTIQAIEHVVKRIKDAFEKKQFAAVISLDISGAFDNAWWSAILQRLRKDDLPHNLFHLCQDYFSGRTAEINIAGCIARKTVTKGCPQGSACGPGFWNVLYDGALKLPLPEGCELVAFADDLILLNSDLDPKILERKVNEAIDRITSWGSDMKLRFNEKKTQAMLCTTRRKIPEMIFMMNGRTLMIVKEIRYLGVTIDWKLNWRKHLQEVQKKVVKITGRISMLASNTWGLKADAVMTMYRGAVEPMILYAVEVWGTALQLKWASATLIRLQRAVLLRICKSYRTVSSDALQILAGVLPLDLKAKMVMILAEIKNRQGGSLSSATRKEVMEGLFTEWDQRWSGSTKGRQTARFFPSVPSRMMLEGYVPNFVATQFMTGHGKFGTYLESMNIRDSSECRCGGVQTPMHLVFDCRFFLQEREQLKRQIEEKGELFEEDQIHHLIINSSIRKRLFRFFNLIHQKLLVWDRDPL